MTKENQEKYDAFKAKLLKEDVYFINSYENAIIKSSPGRKGGYWLKLKGQPAFTTEGSNKVVCDGILEYNEVSKEDFYNW